jgi:hypothetical protein
MENTIERGYMKNNHTILIIATGILASSAIACSMFGGANSNGSSNAAITKGPTATSVCQILAQPTFESSFPYDGKGCSGSTAFGAKDTRAGSYQPDNRPSFSYAVIGENDKISKIMLNMSRRPDGGAFFATEANMVAKMINGQPLPKELDDAIAAPLPASGGLAGYGDAFTTTGQVGGAKAELVKRNSDQGYSLTFQF